MTIKEKWKNFIEFVDAPAKARLLDCGWEEGLSQYMQLRTDIKNNIDALDTLHHSLDIGEGIGSELHFEIILSSHDGEKFEKVKQWFLNYQRSEDKETDSLEALINSNRDLNILMMEMRDKEIDKVLDTQDRFLASVSAKEIEILNKVFNSQYERLKRKLEVLEILKKKKVNITDLIGCLNADIYNSIIPFSSGKLTEEEFIKIRKFLDSK